jgi:hypothetical protein
MEEARQQEAKPFGIEVRSLALIARNIVSHSILDLNAEKRTVLVSKRLSFQIVVTRSPVEATA